MKIIPQVASNRIIRELCESETELDLTLARNASLLATIAQSRVEVGSSFAGGQVAIMRLVRSINSLADARAHLVRTHGELRKIGEERSDLILPHESINSLQAIETDEEEKAA